MNRHRKVGTRVQRRVHASSFPACHSIVVDCNQGDEAHPTMSVVPQFMLNSVDTVGSMPLYGGISDCRMSESHSMLVREQ
jgi:hypothetical protein